MIRYCNCTLIAVELLLSLALSPGDISEQYNSMTIAVAVVGT